MQDLGTLGGTFGFAIWVNEAGEVVGSATTQSDQALHGFRWKKGIMTDLGTVGSLPQSIAEWVNARGQVVGEAASFDFKTQTAFLWENGGPMVDLNTLIPPDSNLHLRVALNINDRGEIAGEAALPNGDLHAVLLIPCGEGTDGCVDAAGSTNGSLATVSENPTNTNRKLTPGEIVSALHNTRHRLYLGGQTWQRK
jgi:probable HAF family extracellular repeat protein